MNKEKLYQCQYNSKQSQARSHNNFFNDWILPKIAFGESLNSDIFTLENFMTSEQTFNGRDYQYSSLAPILARIKFFENMELEVSVPHSDSQNKKMQNVFLGKNMPSV